MNKYEKNISDIIELDIREEITDIFIEHATETKDTIGLIADKELVEYAMGCILDEDWINILRVDLELENDEIPVEYMISIDFDGDLVVQPVVEYNDKYFAAMKHVYISMDGDVSQTTIDNCLNRDVDVVLFGYEDKLDNYDCDKCECSRNDTNTSESTYISRSEDGVPEGFCKSWVTSGNGVTCYSSYSHYSNDVDVLREIAKEFGVEL